jgi:hypothetical protein
MRVSTEHARVVAEPGTAAEILVQVVNTDQIIDGLTARLIGLDESAVRVEPALLPLFPDATGHLTVSVDVPATLVAGRHPLTVEVRSHSTGAVAHLDVDLEVEPRPAVSVRPRPRMVRSKGAGRFVLEVTNGGNVPLEATMVVPPTERGVRTTVNPTVLAVAPGQVAHVLASVRGPRMITGSEVERVVQVELVGRRGGTGTDEDDIESGLDLSGTATLQLRQRPLIARGVLTACVLASILALWAGVFALGLFQVFGTDDVPKTAPASFFVDDAGAADPPGGGDVRPVAAADNPLLLSKTGLVSVDVGGEIGGVVRARSNGQPVGRVTVEAFRKRPSGEMGTEPVSTGATLDDGSFTLVGLFPGDYYVKLSGEGLEPIWFPNAQYPGRAQPITVQSQGSNENNQMVVRGIPGSITGSVDTGDTPEPVTATVTARLLDNEGAVPVPPVSTTTTGSAYRFDNLRAPGTYELTIEADGYQVSKVVQTLGPGEDRQQPSVLLSAGGGRISGLVTLDGKPAGGVTVTTTVNGEPVTVITPTTGAVGRYDIADLPTPGTYLLTFAAPEAATRTAVVRLAAGQSRDDVGAALDAGTGVIRGTVTGPDGEPLGGVQVTVGGVVSPDGTTPGTTTITSGAEVGTFAINDLPVPGTYTLTLSAEGFSPQTVPVTLTEERVARERTFVLSQRLGSIVGVVRTAEGPLIGATVTATDGSFVATTTSGSGSGGLSGDRALEPGGYLLPGLPPGTYSVTITFPERRQVTAIVDVEASEEPSRIRDIWLGRD